MSLTVRTKRGKYTVEIKDLPLSMLIHETGLSLDLQCGGLGICGKCEVELGAGEYLVSGQLLKVAEGEKTKALSCRTKVLSKKASVHVPDSSLLQSSGKIYDDFILKKPEFTPRICKLSIYIPETDENNTSSSWELIKKDLENYFETDISPVSLSVASQIPDALKHGQSITVAIVSSNKKYYVAGIEPGNTAISNYALAIDIGTTTVVLALVDMNNGNIIARTSSYNMQMSKADDIASRISAASASPEDLSYMRKLVVNDTINPLIETACEQTGVKSEYIYAATVSGNTVMSHLFLGLSPESIGKIPFRPVMREYPDIRAAKLGMKINPNGIISVIPSISGYIGGDIVSDIHISGFCNLKEASVLIDLGTNSEMALAYNKKIYACAAAAGPAFEGAGLMCGCRAVDGAIEHIFFDEKLQFTISTIGNKKAAGICGSAIIDFIDCGFKCGLINAFGRYDIDMLKSKNKYLSIPAKNGLQSHACILADTNDPAHPVFVSETDIEQILKAKAAVYSGLKTMLSLHNLEFKDLRKIILAGGFAKYIDIQNAICIGMLPEISGNIIECIGNGSLAGAWADLINTDTSIHFREIINIPEVISLNMIPDFESNFIDALLIPNYNEAEFPQTLALNIL